MENKRAGFSFKAVGVVGFVLLTFILIRVLRLPDGTLSSEMIPNFLMLLLGVLVLASSFVLLALGRIVELLQGLDSSKALLKEIRDETERIRIESQYIYEVQKDTLVKLTNVDETPVVDPYIAHQSQVSAKNIVKNKEPIDKSDVNELLTTDKKDKTTLSSGVDNLVKADTASRGASYAASRLTKNIDQNKRASDQTNQDSDVDFDGDASEELDSKAGAKAVGAVVGTLNVTKASDVDTELQSNTDESSWSTLADRPSTKLDPISKLGNDAELGNESSIEVKQDIGSKLTDNLLDSANESQKTAPAFLDKHDADTLPVEDAESDTAALDGSDDVVDDLSEPKVWKPVSEDELKPNASDFDTSDLDAEKQDLQKSGSQAFSEVKVTEVEDADINASLEEAVGGLEPLKPQNLQPTVYTDRLSQTETLTTKNAVRFGAFPETVNGQTANSQATTSQAANIETAIDSSIDQKTSFTLKDITDEDFSIASGDATVKSDFAPEDKTNKTDSLADVFSTKSESVKSTDAQEDAFPAKGFATVEDSFESAEDSFDDIREVFDTKAKKLRSNVTNIAGNSNGESRIKDSLSQVGDKLTDKAADIGKNLN